MKATTNILIIIKYSIIFVVGTILLNRSNIFNIDKDGGILIAIVALFYVCTILEIAKEIDKV